VEMMAAPAAMKPARSTSATRTPTISTRRAGDPFHLSQVTNRSRQGTRRTAGRFRRPAVGGSGTGARSMAPYEPPRPA
jgi:hypothetical protein